MKSLAQNTVYLFRINPFFLNICPALQQFIVFFCLFFRPLQNTRQMHMIFYLIPWSYFTFGCPVQMQWDETTKIYSFPRIPFNCVGLAVVLFVLFALCVAVNRCFSRKEV